MGTVNSQWNETKKEYAVFKALQVNGTGQLGGAPGRGKIIELRGKRVLCATNGLSRQVLGAMHANARSGGP